MPDASSEPPAPSAAELAAHLLRIGAVMLSPEAPFTWASGLKSPIYCDNRLTLSHLDVRRAISAGFAAALLGARPSPDVVVGTATAGIPHAAWLAERLALPMAYVRSKPKAHGRGNQIEGADVEGRRVVLIEDLISTGGSSLGAAEALRAAGAHVLAVLAVFSYALPVAEQAFGEAGLTARPLTDYPTLLAVAQARGELTDEALATLRAWQRDPQAWSEAHR